MTGAATPPQCIDLTELVDASTAVLARRHGGALTVRDVRPLAPGHDATAQLPVELRCRADGVRARLASGPAAVVVHGDFHPQSVVIDSARRCVTIDWTDAGVADREADFARMETALELGAVGAPSPRQRCAVSLITARFPRRVRGLYEAYTGRILSDDRLGAWRTAHGLHDLTRVSTGARQTTRADTIRAHLLAQLARDGGAR